jgi:hypothetical protein
MLIPHQKWNLAMLWEELGRAQDAIRLCLRDKEMAAAVMVEQGANAPCVSPMTTP